jgi:hypothetical protein
VSAKSKPSGIRQGKARHLVTEIILHCSATMTTGWFDDLSFAEKIAEITRWHTDPKPKGRGWRAIGYHWIIDRDGTLARGRQMTEIGAHVVGHNAGSIGICLIGGGGSSKRDRFLENFTREQDTAARRLIQQIKAATPITKISGHNEYAARACPGFFVPEWLQGVM